jgi:hypothetical protein
MDNSLLQKILSNTYTKSDFYRSISLVQEFLEHAFYNTDDSDDVGHTERIVNHARLSGDVTVAERIEEWGEPVLSVFTRENLYQKLKALKEGIEILPELVLYVPVTFGPREIEQIGRWCRQHIDQTIILNISVEPEVVGGCAFVWKGTYHDFSLRYFLQKKEEEIVRLMSAYDVA